MGSMSIGSHPVEVLTNRDQVDWKKVPLIIGIPGLVLSILDPTSSDNYIGALCLTLYVALPLYHLRTEVYLISRLKRGQFGEDVMAAGVRPADLVDYLALSRLSRLLLQVALIMLGLGLAAVVPMTTGHGLDLPWSLMLGWAPFVLVLSPLLSYLIQASLLLDRWAAVGLCTLFALIYSGPKTLWLVTFPLILLCRLIATNRVLALDRRVMKKKASVRWPWENPFLFKLMPAAPKLAAHFAGGVLFGYYVPLDSSVAWVTLGTAFFLRAAMRASHAVIDERESKTWATLVLTRIGYNDLLVGWLGASISPLGLEIAGGLLGVWLHYFLLLPAVGSALFFLSFAGASGGLWISARISSSIDRPLEVIGLTARVMLGVVTYLAICGEDSFPLMWLSLLLLFLSGILLQGYYNAVTLNFVPTTNSASAAPFRDVLLVISVLATTDSFWDWETCVVPVALLTLVVWSLISPLALALRNQPGHLPGFALGGALGWLGFAMPSILNFLDDVIGGNAYRHSGTIAFPFVVLGAVAGLIVVLNVPGQVTPTRTTGTGFGDSPVRFDGHRSLLGFVFANG